MIAAPPGINPSKISALASAMASTFAKCSRCTASTVVTIAACGRTIFAQRADFTRVVHADFEDPKTRVPRHPRQRQRDAPMIVVGFFRRVRRAERSRGTARSISLVPVLPALPVTAITRASGKPLAGGTAQRFKRLQRVRHFEQRPVAGLPLIALGDKRGSGTRLEGGSDEVVPVPLILQRDEKIARLQRPRVDRNARDGARTAALGIAAERGAQFGERPKRLH